MNIKLIATDLDGTLLNTDKSLSEENINALKEADSYGIYVVIATGRPISGIKDLLEKMPFIKYAVIMNGACVWDVYNSKALYKANLTTEQALEIWDFVQKYNTMTDVHVGGVGRISPYYMKHCREYMISDELVKLLKKTRVEEQDVRAVIASSADGAEKINLTFKSVEDKEKALKELERFDYAVALSSVSNNIEINHVNATKGAALRSLAHYLDIDMRDVMAFGDNQNDFSMIKESGYGIAMKNGTDDIKKAAYFVTGDNDSSGVACAVYKMLQK